MEPPFSMSEPEPRHPRLKSHKSRLATKAVHKDKIHSLGWNKSGSRLASSSADCTASVLSVSSTTLHREFDLKGHTAKVDQLCWDPTRDDVLATVSSDDKTIRIWDSRSGTSTQVIPTDAGNINIAWSPDGKTLAVGNTEEVITLVDARMYKPLATKKFSEEMNELSFNNSGDLLFVMSSEGFVKVLSMPAFKESQSIFAHTANAMSIKFDPLGKRFATGGHDSLVMIWDTEELICTHSYAALEFPIRGLSFSHDGEFVAIASEDNDIPIISASTAELVHKVHPKSEDGTTAVAWHPSHLSLAYTTVERSTTERDPKKELLYVVSIFGA